MNIYLEESSPFNETKDGISIDANEENWIELDKVTLFNSIQFEKKRYFQSKRQN